jgi:hypothetical protein
MWATMAAMVRLLPSGGFAFQAAGRRLSIKILVDAVVGVEGVEQRKRYLAKVRFLDRTRLERVRSLRHS